MALRFNKYIGLIKGLYESSLQKLMRAGKTSTGSTKKKRRLGSKLFNIKVKAITKKIGCRNNKELTFVDTFKNFSANLLAP